MNSFGLRNGISETEEYSRSGNRIVRCQKFKTIQIANICYSWRKVRTSLNWRNIYTSNYSKKTCTPNRRTNNFQLVALSKKKSVNLQREFQTWTSWRKGKVFVMGITHCWREWELWCYVTNNTHPYTISCGWHLYRQSTHQTAAEIHCGWRKKWAEVHVASNS